MNAVVTSVYHLQRPFRLFLQQYVSVSYPFQDNFCLSPLIRTYQFAFDSVYIHGTVCLEKLVFIRPGNKFSNPCGTLSFIFVFRKARQRTPSLTCRIYQLGHVCPSFCPHKTTRFPPDEFSSKFVMESLLKFASMFVCWFKLVKVTVTQHERMRAPVCMCVCHLSLYQRQSIFSVGYELMAKKQLTI